MRLILFGIKMRLVFFLCLLLIVSIDSRATVFFSDGFETGNLSMSESGFTWGTSTGGANESPVVSTDVSHSGLYSLKFTFNGNADLADDAWSEQRFNLGGNYSELWIKFNLYIPTNYYQRGTQAGNNNKALFQIWGNVPGQSTSNPQAMGFECWPEITTGSSLLSSHVKPDGNDQGHVLNGTYFVNRDTDLGKWIEWIVQVKVASIANNDGIIRVWKNGQLVVNLSNVSNYVTDFNWFSAGYLLGWANSGFDQDTYLYIDDVVFSTDSDILPKKNIGTFIIK